MTNQPTARAAADLPEGTRVVSPEGRFGTAMGCWTGRVTNPDHENFGREYTGVKWDADEKTPWGETGRPFVDELVIVVGEAVSAGCARHGIEGKRGGRAIELGTIPACESGTTYGAWSEGAGGFVYSGVDCAADAANWAADELRQLTKDDDTDTIQIFAICPDHEEQPKGGCEECNAEGDEEEEDDAEESEAVPGTLVDPWTWLRRSY